MLKCTLLYRICLNRQIPSSCSKLMLLRGKSCMLVYDKAGRSILILPALSYTSIHGNYINIDLTRINYLSQMQCLIYKAITSAVTLGNPMMP